MINNGGFESSANCGQFDTPYNIPAPSIDCWIPLSNTPDLYKRNCTTGTNSGFNLGVSTYSSSPPTNSHVGGSTNNNFIGLYGPFYEAIQTQLSSPLISNQQYVISFWAKNNNGVSSTGVIAPISISSYNGLLAPINLMSGIPFQTQVPSSVQIVPTTSVPNDNSWHYYSYTFTFPLGTPNYNNLALYTGYLNGFSYVFIDDVSILPVNNGTFTLPATICSNQTIPDLKTYLSGLPLTGVFSGLGVSLSGGIYKFNAAIVPLGINTISYTYTNSSNCSVTIYCNITVIQAPSVPVITGSVSVCTTSSPTKTYSTTLGTGETATWSIVSGAGAGTIANPNSASTNITWTTLPATLKLTITNSAGCTSSTNLNIGSVCSTCSCLNNLTLTKSVGINGTGLYLTIGGNTCTQDFVTDSINFGDGSPIEYDNGGYSYHQYMTSGNYTVTYTITLLGGCTATAKFLISAIGCSTCDPSSKINSIQDITENNQYKMEVNPNPTNGFLNVRINNYVGKVNIQVIDINGRVVSEYKNEEFNIEKSLNLNNLQTGMYVLKVSGDSLNFTQK